MGRPRPDSFKEAPSGYLSVGQVMARKCVGNHRIIRAIKEGELPGAKIEDGMWIVPSEVVRKWAVKPSRNRL